METLQPKLRFPEFDGNWDNKKLNKICDVRDGTHDSPKYYETGYPFVTSKNLTKDGHLDFSNINFICESDYNKFNKRSGVSNGDILFGMIGTIGNPVLVKSEGFAIKNVALLKEINELKNFFLIHYLNANNIQNQFKEQNTGGTQKFLSLSIIRNLNIKFPSLEEQTKIANFLSSVDEKLNLLKEKKELLEDYKKGVMQKIFNQEIRFKDDNGNDFEDWEENNIGNILTIGSGRDYKHLNFGSVPVFGTGGLMTYVDSCLHKGETVCIGRKGTIDKPMYHNGDIWTVDTLFYTHSFINSIPKFVYYVFQSINWKKHNEGSGVPSLSKSTIEQIIINVPSTLEQIKIANFLSSIDEKIELVSNQIQDTQEYKKGLLQQMFV